MDEVTVSAPRAFDGVLGRAADLWMKNNVNKSTYGNIGFNFNHNKLDPLNLQPDYYGFQIEASVAFFDLGYSVSISLDEISGEEEGGCYLLVMGGNMGLMHRYPSVVILDIQKRKQC